MNNNAIDGLIDLIDFAFKIILQLGFAAMDSNSAGRFIMLLSLLRSVESFYHRQMIAWSLLMIIIIDDNVKAILLDSESPLKDKLIKWMVLCSRVCKLML